MAGAEVDGGSPEEPGSNDGTNGVREKMGDMDIRNGEKAVPNGSSEVKTDNSDVD